MNTFPVRVREGSLSEFELHLKQRPVCGGAGALNMSCSVVFTFVSHGNVLCSVLGFFPSLSPYP